MPWQIPKINWLPTDFYNSDDLNRVENNIQHLATMLGSYLGQTITLSVVLNRTMTRFEYFDSLNRIESNISLLVSKFYIPAGWEASKTTWSSDQAFGYSDANRLERNLFLLYELLNKTIDNYKFSGTFSSGEAVL
ncbi:hypothetical protein [Paenibacillus sp. FSL E2-0190]|uniref:hypothetical protein n=1 Tax=Paenibacillus sp. FSL E2-0190 TaxID=2954504 RepID=UPI0030EBD9E8